MSRGYRPRTSARPSFRRVEPAPGPPAPGRRLPRAVRPLPEGPFRVPISTIDWLVSRESPAARVVALRDLLGRPAKDIELRKAKQALARDPFVRDVLALLRSRLAPGPRTVPLEHKYDGGAWLALFLGEMGGDTTLPALRHAGDVLFARWEKALVAVERHGELPRDVPDFVTACRALALLGHGGDPRLLHVADALARRAVEGRGETAKELLFFAALPEAKRPETVRPAIAFLVARAEDAELPGPAAVSPPRTFLAAGFPTGETTDYLELLYALAGVDARRRPGLEKALAFLASRADHRARWRLERALPEKLPVALEREGELSRWVTIRALVVLQHFVGLSIEGVK
jgi:hypothetical protein